MKRKQARNGASQELLDWLESRLSPDDQITVRGMLAAVEASAEQPFRRLLGSITGMIKWI